MILAALLTVLVLAVLAGPGQPAARAQQPSISYLPYTSKEPIPILPTATPTPFPTSGTVDGCNAYPIVYFFADFLVVSGIIRNPSAGGIADPRVTVHWLDSAGKEIATWNEAAASSYLSAQGAMGVHILKDIASVPANWSSIRCEWSGTGQSQQGYNLQASSVTYTLGGHGLVNGTIRNLSNATVSNWALYVAVKNQNGTVLASQLVQRTDSIASGGSVNFSLELDRAPGDVASAEAVASDGIFTPNTPTPIPTATNTPLPTPTQTSTPATSATPTTPTATATATPVSASNWTTVTSPITVSLRALSLTSDDEGWAVGDNGAILKLQGGAWLSATSPATVTLRAIDMVNSEAGFAVGDQSTLLGYRFSPTNTLSTRWFPIDIINKGPGDVFMAASFLSSTYGMIGASTGAIGTFNEPVWADYLTKTTVMLDYQQVVTGASISGVSLVSPTLAYATTPGADGVSPAILSWNGTYWTQVYKGSTPLRAITSISGTTVAAGDSGTLLMTTGITGPWTPISSTTAANLLATSWPTKTLGFAAGSGGIIARVTATGTLEAGSTTANTLNGIGAVSQSRGWAVGDNGTILHYTNPAIATSTPTATPTPIWQAPVQPTPILNIVGVAAVTGTQVYAASGTSIIQSSNGISDWTPMTVPIAPGILSIAASPGGMVWASGTGGHLMTLNGGVWGYVGTGMTDTLSTIPQIAVADPLGGLGIMTPATTGPRCCLVRGSGGWSVVPSGPPEVTWNGVALQNQSAGWVVGYTGTNPIAMTAGVIGAVANGSITMVPVPPSQALNAVAALPNGYSVAVGLAGTVMEYDPTGLATWFAQPSPDASVNLQGVVLTGRGEGWAYGTNSELWRLTGGVWRIATPLDFLYYPFTGTINGMAALQTGDVWIATNDGKIYRRAANGSIQANIALRSYGGW